MDNTEDIRIIDEGITRLTDFLNNHNQDLSNFDLVSLSRVGFALSHAKDVLTKFQIDPSLF